VNARPFFAPMTLAATLGLHLAGCEASLESGCLDGTCTTTTTNGSGGGGADGGDAGGAGGQASECLACLPDVGPQEGALPCDVAQVLEDKCQRCHQDPPQNGAPFPLLDYDDTQAMYAGKPIFVRMKIAIESGFMPLTPPKLTASEKDTMLAWLCACAPPAPADTTCP
jgi:hypothetical protein